jgi:uncharacterized membrane protein
MWESIQDVMIGNAGQSGPLHVTFNNPLGLELSLLLLALLAAAAGVLYWTRLRRARRGVRVLLTALRVAAVVLALALLLDLSLAGEARKDIEQVVAVLIDNSRSMQIAGEDGAPRGQAVIANYLGDGDRVDAELRRRFHVVRYGFGASAARLDDVHALDFQQTESDILGSLDGLMDDLGGANVAAVVLFSDGVQQPAAAPDDTRLRALGVPVFAVATGSPDPWRDLRLADLSVRRTSLDKSPVIATLRVEAAGLDGVEAVAEIVQAGRVLASQAFTVDGVAASHTVRLEFIPTQTGWLTCEARVRPAARRATATPKEIAATDTDWIPQNNTRTFTVDNREKVYRVLYLTGSPTWEHKFFRRALADDSALQLTSLVRVARAERTFEFRGRSGTTNPLFRGFYQQAGDQPRYDEAVFLRLGVEESELTSGYPAVAGELFPYHLVIWNAIEHDFFSQTQLELTKAFVERRGGSFLMMGGPRSFAEGGFRGTILDSMFPVVLRAERAGSRLAATGEPFAVTPTPEGIISGAWALDAQSGTNDTQWDGLPRLFGLNSFSLLRPGASIMARIAAADPQYDGQPFFAVQRYGEGQSAVLATGRTWRWHMQTPEDQDSVHERLWRQIVRSLVADVPEPVVLRNKPSAVTVNEEVPLEFLIRDHAFEPAGGLQTRLELLHPDGSAQDLPVEESIRDTGIYTSAFTPQAAGDFTLRVTATGAQSDTFQQVEERVTVEVDRREFDNARPDPAFLEHIARVTGGGVIALEDLARLPGRIPDERRQAAEADLDHLWHRPPFLILFAMLLTAEWYIRRKWGEP